MGAGRQARPVAGELSQAARITAVLRVVLDRRRSAVTARSNRARDPQPTLRAMQAIRAHVDDGEPIHVILDNLNHHKNRDVRDWCEEHTSSSCSRRPTRRGRTRSRRTSGRYASSSSRTATTPTIPRSAERSANTSAGGTATPATHASSTAERRHRARIRSEQQRRWGRPRPPRHSARTFVVRALAVLGRDVGDGPLI